MPASSPDHEPERLLTKDDVAERLQVSVRTVERLASSGELKSIRVGQLIRFHPDDVSAYVDALREQG